MSGKPSIGDPAPRRPIGRVLGVVLAGGLSRRMGVEKGLLLLNGKPLIAHVIDRLAPQVDGLVINANGAHARYAGYGSPVIADTLAGNPGPLAGALAAMRWAETHARDVTHIATVPVDTPFFPLDLLMRLAGGLVSMPSAMLAFATTSESPQPVFALVDIGLADDLERDIIAGTARRVGDWLRGHSHAEVIFEAPDAFFNVNTPEDLVTAENIAKAAH